MGEYIKTGIAAEFRIYKSGISKTAIAQEEIGSKLAAAVVGNPASFDCNDSEDCFFWRLKQDVIEKCLPIFVKRYFNDFCNGNVKDYDSHCKPILDFLATNPSADKLDDWDEDSDYEIILDDDEIEYIYIDKSKIRVNFSILELTSEGKVMYEEIDQHLTFFKSAMRKAYADDPLGGCLMVTIG